MSSKEIFSIKNKNVIITGGGRGLGFEIANYFQNNGAKVFVFDKSFNKKFLNKDVNKIKCNIFEKKKNIN